MNELLKKLSKEILSGTEVGEIIGNPKDFPIRLIEKLSIETALNYWNGKIDFEEGDCIMNNLQGFWVTNDHYCQNFAFGKIPWACYEAFDAGEYLGTTDNSDIDPVEVYTKPMIYKLLREIKLIN
ncbi:hypothetical protein UMM65_13900 [Aureibaculum sp. 2210JD6-5]|uniref:hypothetical protein n=1 Tax=Aureibaculum sp. 2210JD6-5 TaxID=3103957 RepID=UPI002AAE4CB9|nr:hypothetical protein [Aureibaculum sp. 2210JD6-5]MDY7396340.1 hypothetical protein [Aureibaculum sp. 2210JD6-5]